MKLDIIFSCTHRTVVIDCRCFFHEVPHIELVCSTESASRRTSGSPVDLRLAVWDYQRAGRPPTDLIVPPTGAVQVDDLALVKGSSCASSSSVNKESGKNAVRTTWGGGWPPRLPGGGLGDGRCPQALLTSTAERQGTSWSCFVVVLLSGMIIVQASARNRCKQLDRVARMPASTWLIYAHAQRLTVALGLLLGARCFLCWL